MANAPSDAEFATWLTPAAALERLPSEWNLATKRDAIISRIRDGSLLALARTVSVQNRGEAPKHYPMTAITPELWREPFRCRDKAFWTTGDLTFDDEPPLNILYRWDAQPGDDEAQRIITFKDMRIEPGSFAREFANHLPPDKPKFGPSSERESAHDSVTADEFATWLTPKAALAAVPSDIDEAERRPWIIRRLRAGQITAAAERMRVDGNGGPFDAPFAVIERRYWDEKWRELGDWFASGDREVTDAPEQNSAGKRISLTAWTYDPEKYTITQYSVVKFLGLRLDPAGFPAKPAPTTVYLPPAPSPDDFAQWWHPSDAVDSFLSLGDDQAREAVRSLLSAGAVAAAAERLILDDEVLDLSGLPKELWAEVRDTRFWSSGFFKIRFGRTNVTAFGVKLDPDAVCAHAPPRPPRPSAPLPIDVKAMMEGLDALVGPVDSDPSPPPPPEAKRLSEGSLAEWAKLFFAANPSATEKEARQSLSVMFPKNSVSRARLRAVMPPRQRGRPLKPTGD